MGVENDKDGNNKSRRKAKKPKAIMQLWGYGLSKSRNWNCKKYQAKQ